MPEEQPMQPAELPLQPEAPDMPQMPPEMPGGPSMPPKKRRGWYMSLAAIVVIVLAGGAVFMSNGNLFEPNYRGPTAAFVLNGADIPTGWFLMSREALNETADGFVEGTAILINKKEGNEDISSVFSDAWLFSNSSAAKAFEERIWDQAASGTYNETNAEDIGTCRSLVKPLPPFDGDDFYVICRNANLVWRVESRSTIKAAHLYAPMFANAVAEKMKQG